MPTPPPSPTFRAEHIGSLLRPPELLAARTAFEADGDPAKLRAAEDKAIREVVRRQEALGLGPVTDGEFRRDTYSDSFTTSGLAGVAVTLTEEEGWRASAAHGNRMARRIPRVVGRIAWKGDENARDFAFLKSVTTATPKLTLPGPAYIHYRTGREHVSREVYPDLEAFWADLVAAYHAELAALAKAGCDYVQLDETSLVKLGDPRARELLAARGDDWQKLLPRYVAAINAVVAGAPKGMRVAIHVCRSQDPSWQATASYEPIADAMFNGINIGAYFLEWDTPRAGSFEPLKHLPKGKRVVLGLVSSRAKALEDGDMLKRRIDEAARFAPLEQLGLSPHCGFSTSARDADPELYEMQWQKLARVVEVARAVWGEA
ncbi:MAG TPA: 5-methyltetrahydropteroyltriglutamate--homocysteine S-methyltransferase [Stellaceae bacterium]|nr:5-methyltetrahydropteroyltriglutamate--homocysteine S-methyltransferase [Stellaceae bacterium]